MFQHKATELIVSLVRILAVPGHDKDRRSPDFLPGLKAGLHLPDSCGHRRGARFVPGEGRGPFPGPADSPEETALSVDRIQPEEGQNLVRGSAAIGHKLASVPRAQTHLRRLELIRTGEVLSFDIRAPVVIHFQNRFRRGRGGQPKIERVHILQKGRGFFVPVAEPQNPFCRGKITVDHRLGPHLELGGRVGKLHGDLGVLGIDLFGLSYLFPSRQEIPRAGSTIPKRKRQRLHLLFQKRLNRSVHRVPAFRGFGKGIGGAGEQQGDPRGYLLP